MAPRPLDPKEWPQRPQRTALKTPKNGPKDPLSPKDGPKDNQTPKDGPKDPQTPKTP